MTKPLKNLTKSPEIKEFQISTIYDNTLKIIAVSFSAGRLAAIFKKKVFKEIVHIFIDNHLASNPVDEDILLILEYVGEGDLQLEFIDTFKETFPQSNIFSVVDDTYEGMLTQEKVDSILNLRPDISIFSSNELLQGENVYSLNQHLYSEYYDNIDIKKHKEKTVDALRTKKFICLNRQERLHRLQTVDFLIKNEILPHSYTSCGLSDFLVPLKKIDPFEVDGKANVEGTAANYYSKRIYASFDEVSAYKPDNDEKERLLKHLPLSIDGDTSLLNPKNMPDLESYFNDAYWAIITERDFYKSHLYKGFTEKVLKCFIYKNPFVVIGLPNTLTILKDLGFLTFSRYIDESYDTIEDNELRMKKAFEQIDYLNSLNYIELDLMMKDMESILSYNYSHYKKLNQTVPSNFVNHILKLYKY